MNDIFYVDVIEEINEDLENKLDEAHQILKLVLGIAESGVADFSNDNYLRLQDIDNLVYDYLREAVE